MNKKLQTISMLSATVLILALAGCDWCSCCKKDGQPSKPEKVAPKETHPIVKPVNHAEPVDHAEPLEPKIMPEHPMEPKVMPVMPIEPKVAPMPPAPKAV